MSRKVLAIALSVFALVLGSVTGPAVSAADAKASVPNPTVFGPIRGGVHGYPWNHSLFKLRRHEWHYTEKEYFFSGTATDLSSGAQAPYESRMVVRLPGDRRKFNGEVLVEWLNVTGQMDLETACRWRGST